MTRSPLDILAELRKTIGRGHPSELRQLVDELEAAIAAPATELHVVTDDEARWTLRIQTLERRIDSAIETLRGVKEQAQ